MEPPNSSGEQDMDDRQQGAKPSSAKLSQRTVASAAIGVLALAIGWIGLQGISPLSDAKAQADPNGTFVVAVLGDIENQWKVVLGDRYRPVKLVLYTRRATTRGCGRARAMDGPFYCPDDDGIYLDSSFFSELRTRACRQQGEACEFARAYVIAHEFGHHVQNVLGTLARVDAYGFYEASRGLAARVELQADCFAGIWAGLTTTRWKNVTPAMVAAATEAAQFGGDDHSGAPPWETTHGTSSQRGTWFKRGFEGKSLASCNTFAGRHLTN
jgi:predicted metalloprotease